MATHSEPITRNAEPLASSGSPAFAALRAATFGTPDALQGALNDSARVQPQLRLQRMLAEGPGVAAQMRYAASIASTTPTTIAAVEQPVAQKQSVKVVSAPPLPAVSGPVAQRILIKVSTERTDNGPRRISRVQFAERVPTTVSGGQGDHTVAEALVELTMDQFSQGKTHAELAAQLPQLLGHLNEQAKAKYLSEDGHFEKLEIADINKLMGEYRVAANSGTTDGEDLNNALERIYEMFLRLWNKRAGAAYLRKQGLTSGGGDEKFGKKQILGVAGLFSRDDSDEKGEQEDWKGELAEALNHMIDFNVDKDNFVLGEHGVQEAARHLVTAINLVLEIIPDAEFYYNDVMTYSVEIYARKAGLNQDQEELLDQRVADLMRGADQDFEDLYDDDDEILVDEVKQQESVSMED